MERDDRQLDRERDEEPQHQQHAGALRHRGAEQLEIVEGELARRLAVHEGQREDRQQHQQPTALGEQEELDSRMHPTLVAPDRHQEIHRDQHDFPEEEEQEKVGRQEHADDAGCRCQQADMEEADMLLHLAPGDHDAGQGERQGQPEQQQAEPVHVEAQRNTELRDPGRIEMREPARRQVGGRSGTRRQSEDRRVDEQRPNRHPARPVGARPATKAGDQCGDQRDDDQCRQHHESTAMVSAASDPAASQPAYQRTRPFSLRLNAPCARCAQAPSPS